ncbi:hypothetical protein [Microbacterium sp. W4I20]|uniref:hypothetical protein n=1 Tax=Microbacterium sp. W4I20 TaxID=3042262 RepID=UPI002786E520|nr:hypothetical protein [Microbacterium sp. W4I20]MDQ0725195.1 hypothetical protein [Microbacterium sp. W4I20]
MGDGSTTAHRAIPSWTRTTGLVVLIAASVSLLTGCTADATPQPSVVSEASHYALALDTDYRLVTIHADGALTTPVIDDEPIAGDGARVAPLDGGRLAVLAGDALIVLSDGEVSLSATCAGCHGLTATEAGLVTAQQSFTPGIDFDLVTFDEGLAEVGRVNASFVRSRFEPSLMPKMRFPTVEASVDGLVLVSAISARGGEAGNGRLYGPWSLGFYEQDGTLTRDTEILGHNGVGPVDVSSDGRFSAVQQGTTWGACYHGEDVVIVDNRAGEIVDTDPVTTGAEDEQMVVTAGWWDGGRYVVDVTIEHDEGEQCEFKRTSLRGSIDAETGVTDTSPVTTHTWGAIGEGCDAVLSSPVGPLWELTDAISLGSEPLKGIARILHAPTGSDCDG